MKPGMLQYSLITTTLLVLGSSAVPVHAHDIDGEWRRDSREIRLDRQEIRHHRVLVHQGQATYWQGSRR